MIEVVTSRHTNVQRHREVQDAVKQAVSRALALVDSPPAGAAGTAHHVAAAAAASQSAGLTAAAAPFELAVHSASYQAFSLPLAKPLTTAADGEEQRRRGFLLRLSLVGPGGSTLAHGVGEVAPLPGLHTETLEEAEAQLALLCQLLSAGGSDAAAFSSSNGSAAASAAAVPSSAAVAVPLTAALLGGRLGAWLQQRLGVEPDSLLPSVRCGLEAALLSAIAQARLKRVGGGHLVDLPAGAAFAWAASWRWTVPASCLKPLIATLLPCSTRACRWRSCWPVPPLPCRRQWASMGCSTAKARQRRQRQRRQHCCSSSRMLP